MQDPANGEGDLLILLQVQGHTDDGTHDLAEYCGVSRAGHTELRKSEQAEDQNGVEDDVENSAGSLGDHAVDGPARGLQKTLKGHLEEQADAQAAHDPQVGRRIICHHLIPDRIRHLRHDKRMGSEDPDEKEGQVA